MWRDLLWPLQCLGCNVVLRDQGANPAACRSCLREIVPLAPGARGCFVYTGPLAKALTRLKFRGTAALAGPLGAAWAGHSTFPGGAEVVIPVPLHWTRRLARGFDQTRLLATFAMAHLRQRGHPTPDLDPGSLIRTRRTVPQTRLDAAARRENVAHAFQVTRPLRLRGRSVLLLDDVTTTGATLQAAADAVRAAGADPVRCLALLERVS